MYYIYFNYLILHQISSLPSILSFLYFNYINSTAFAIFIISITPTVFNILIISDILTVSITSFVLLSLFQNRICLLNNALNYLIYYISYIYLQLFKLQSFLMYVYFKCLFALTFFFYQAILRLDYLWINNFQQKMNFINIKKDKLFVIT